MTSERKRNGGIDPPAWWGIAAADAKRDRGFVNEKIAIETARVLGVDVVDVSRVTRCLNGSNATIQMLDAISTVLGIPSPVYIAESREEAVALSSASAVEKRRAAALSRADAKIESIRTEVSTLAKRQSTALPLGHGESDGLSVGGVAHRRRISRTS